MHYWMYLIFKSIFDIAYNQFNELDVWFHDSKTLEAPDGCGPNERVWVCAKARGKAESNELVLLYSHSYEGLLRYQAKTS